ncbi:oligosaccharide flippase family protein [Paenibacillus sp. F411]|uniref:oligosaccharide flippase family protein n=1 Tax=Paenibacillus sp. F411 TaxID=2820239 RepID=UPI001AAE2D5C|nr:oligosaccharide flippase family protein [Paenibacillus sp. F411]MBO2943793.1 oligosaccharide flippase family protein [Paenibacillus sp. F411]
MMIVKLANFRNKRGSIGNVFQVFASNVFILGLNVVTGIIIARYLGPEGRGEQAAMIMWPRFLAYSLTMGVPTALIYFMKRKDEDQGSLYITALYMSIILGIIAMALGSVIIPFWMKDYSTLVVEFATLALVMSPVALIGSINTAALQSRGEYRQFNFMRYSPVFGTLIILLILVFTNHVTPFMTSIAFLVPVIPIAIWTTVRLVSYYKIKQRQKRRSAKKLMSYGIRSYGTDVAGTFSGYIDQILVVGLLSPSALGLYVVSLNLAKMLNTLQNAITTVLYPKASELGANEALDLTFRVFRFSSIITVLIGALVFIAAPYALIMLYGSSFDDAVPVFRILIFQTALASLSWILSQGFMSIGRPGAVTIVRLITLGSNVILLNILIPWLGIHGAAISLLISSCVEFFIISFIYKMKHKVMIKQWLISGKDIRWVFERVQQYRSKY